MFRSFLQSLVLIGKTVSEENIKMWYNYDGCKVMAIAFVAGEYLMSQ
jgi:hypothetical protein